MCKPHKFPALQNGFVKLPISSFIIIGVPTSKRIEKQARSLNIPLSVLDHNPRLDLAIDGADEVDPYLNLVKGRSGALLREKMVEAASENFVIVMQRGGRVMWLLFYRLRRGRRTLMY
ncbi:hypothetical protein RYX36_005158 [Vicia faba]